jgi:hypothetical protein
MNTLSRSKTWLLRMIALMAALPAILYFWELVRDVAIAVWKMPWDWEPCVFISPQGILIFSLHSTVWGLALITAARLFRDTVLNVLGWALIALLALYLGGFVFRVFGVL